MTKDLGALFRRQLANLRDSKGLSQVKLSEMIGAGQQYVAQVEIGRIKTPPLKKLKKLASALDVSVGDLFFIEGLDDNPELLRSRIHALAETNNVNQLRKFYRLMLISLEKK
jgi:transcriptional regulator with XRE-family HTH domain